MNLLLSRERKSETESVRDQARTSEKLCSTGWLSCPKGFPSAKPHPKAQEVHRLALSQGESIPRDSDRLGGDGAGVPTMRDGGGEGNVQERK